MNNCMYAHTAPGSNYPPYVNVSREDDGSVVITVRSPAGPDGCCGNTASATLSAEQFDALLKECGGG